MALAILRLLILLGICGTAIYALLRFLRPNSLPKGESTDPYSILGVSRNATENEIKEAYHGELAKYHPDKVAHLGEELQNLARIKTTAIIEAYNAIKKQY